MSEDGKQAKLAEMKARIEEKKRQLELLRQQRASQQQSQSQYPDSSGANPPSKTPISPPSTSTLTSAEAGPNAPIAKRPQNFSSAAHPPQKFKPNRFPLNHNGVDGQAQVQLEQWDQNAYHQHYPHPHAAGGFYHPYYYPGYNNTYHDDHGEDYGEGDEVDEVDETGTGGEQSTTPKPNNTTTTEPAFKSRSLCTSWPNCRFDEGCRFSHPVLDTAALAFLNTQRYISQQPPALTTAVSKAITTAMTAFSSQVGTSGKPEEKYANLDPVLPQLDLASFPSSPLIGNNTPQQVIDQINGVTSPVPFISFLFDKLKQQNQFKAVKQDVLSLLCGLPTISTIIASINAHKAAMVATPRDQSKTCVEMVAVRCQTKMLGDAADDQPQTSATMVIITPTHSTESRVHIIPSLHYQKLFAQSFQLITTTNCKSFFLALNSSNPHYDASFADSFIPVSEANTNNERTNDKPDRRSDKEERAFFKKRRQLDENPAFRVYPINFVHGGRIIQKSPNASNDPNSTDDMVMVPVKGSGNGGNNNNNNSNPKTAPMPTSGSGSGVEIPSKYQHMKPYLIYRNPNIFYTFDQIIQQRHGAQIALADRMSQRGISNGFGPGSGGAEAMMNKYRATQAFMPSTIAKPYTYFKPYSLSNLNKSSNANAGAMGSTMQPYQQYNGDDDSGFGMASQQRYINNNNNNNSFSSHNNSFPSNSLFPSHNSWPSQHNQPSRANSSLQDDLEDQRLMVMYSKSHVWLENRGWKPGQSLGGNNPHNITKPIDGVIRPERYGLGNVDDDDDEEGK